MAAEDQGLSSARETSERVPDGSQGKGPSVPSSPYWIGRGKPAQRTAVVPGPKVIEPRFLIAFFAGKLLVHRVIAGTPLSVPARRVCGNLLAKGQEVVAADQEVPGIPPGPGRRRRRSAGSCRAW
jgi:hypothetical protein